MVKHVVLALCIALALAGCDATSSFTNAMAQSTDAATSIEKLVGVKPDVGFNYHNGSLAVVTVQFRAVPSASITELEKVVRGAVVKAFKSEPANLVVAFLFAKAP
jgi:hypothetical protein